VLSTGQPVADRARQGHAVVHQTGHHGDFPTGAVAAVAAAAFVFGTAVLILEALG
jgi:hypothetical protein